MDKDYQNWTWRRVIDSLLTTLYCPPAVRVVAFNNRATQAAKSYCSISLEFRLI